MASEPDQIGLIMQLRRRGIRDTRVLRAIEQVPRELFVDPAFADHAYQDIALPIDCGQTISQPYVVAFMTEKLDLDDNHRGAGDRHRLRLPGCGAVASLPPCLHRGALARAAKAADRRFAKLGIANVTTIIGDGWIGWPPQAPMTASS